MINYLKYTCVLLFWLPVSVLASEAPKFQQIIKVFDDTSISISMPNDLIDSSSSSYATSLAASLPANSVLLGMYSSSNDEDDISIIGIRKARGGSTVSLGFFQAVKEYFHSNYAELTKVPDYKSGLAALEASINNNLSQAAGENMNLAFDQMIILSIFDESPRHLSALTLSRRTLTIGSTSTIEVSAGTITYYYINGKVVTVNFYKKFSGKDSYDAVKQLAISAAKLNLENNR